MSAAAASIEPGGALLLAGGTLAASGLGVAAGGLVSGQGWIGAAVDDGGTLQASGGLLRVSGAISGSGAVLIGGGAALSAAFGIAASVSVAFTGGNATLDLFGSAVSTGATITGLGASPGNGIDLTGAAVTAAVYTDLGGGLGSLALTGPGGSLGALTLAGEDSGASAVIGSDGHGGSLIQLVPCFVAGARIATPDGPVPVERLRPGDLVLTPDGPRRLRWAGRRRCDGAAAAELRPVCIGQGALGGGLPERDLWLSPRHAVMLGRTLMPAIALLNGGSIRRGPPGVVRYHHLGLDRHALLLAEGVLAESWMPSAVAAFDWESGERPAPGPPCAPLLDSGPALEAALRHQFRSPPAAPAPAGQLLGHIERIATCGQRTRLEGWALDEAAPDRPVVLLAHAGGQTLGCAVANLWRPDLDRAGLAGGRCGFALELPVAAPDIMLRRRADGQALPNSCANAI